VPNKTGPSIIAKEGGNLLFLSSDGSVYELTMAGGLISNGKVGGITNIVSPAAYVNLGSSNYLVYVTAQGVGQNKLVVHRVSGSSSQAYSRDISSAAYGVASYSTASNIMIYFGTMDGKIFKAEFDGSNLSTVSKLIGSPIKIAPILSPSKDHLYVLAQNGNFYDVAPNTLDATLKITLGGEFTTPMAMNESGIIYALNLTGTLYRIDASGNEIHQKVLPGCDNAGVLIDGDGYIYVFGGGKVAVLNDNLITLASYTLGQKVTATPSIVKGSDGITYIITPSSDSYSSGKVSILSFNPTSGVLTDIWNYQVPSSLPISAAISVAPVGSINNDNYYFATATNDGTVYAWQFDARGPYGIWATYGQNTYRSGFIDASATLFRTRIRIIAVEGLNGNELSSEKLGGTNYGLKYDARIINSDNSVETTLTNLRTNESILTKMPQGIPGSQRLEVTFSTPTSATLLFTPQFRSTVQGVNPPSIDSEFGFRFWETGPNAYEGSEGDNPATLTFRFNDKQVKVYADATYTYYIYHKYPLDADAEVTETKYGFFDYGSYKSSTTIPRITIKADTSYKKQDWYAFKWNVYQWDPAKPGGIDKNTYGSKEEISLELKGPGYVEIYYAQLGATITLLLPEYAYGRTRAYLFLDAATGSIVYTMNLKTKNDVRIESVMQPDFVPNIQIVEATKTTNNVKYVLQSIENKLPSPTRVATIVLNLDFPQKTQFTGTNDTLFSNFFDLYGYVQITGQLIDSQELKARSVYRTNPYLYVLGDFDGDFDVDINDWQFFLSKYGSTVSGDDLIYNLGPREGFIPYSQSSYSTYRAGFLTDNTNMINEEDLYVFASMFGLTVPEDAWANW